MTMIILYAQPYDMSAKGFCFTSVAEFKAKSQNLKNTHGNIVEEFEIQFIDGPAIDAALSEAVGLNQMNLNSYFKAVEAWNDHDKRVVIIACGDFGYSFDENTLPDDFEIDVYYLRYLGELAEEFVAEGLYGEIPPQLEFYINYEAIGRDLAMDYTEAEIAGEYLIYRAA